MAGFDLRGGNTKNYVLGRGKVYISGDVTKTTGYSGATANSNKVWRDIGNVTAFTISQESETKEHKSSLEGLQVIDLEVPVSQKMSVSFTVDELNVNNLARFLSGDYRGFDNDTLGIPIGNGAAMASDDADVQGGDHFYVTTLGSDHVTDVWYDVTLRFANQVYRCIDFEPQATQAFGVHRNPTSARGITGGTDLVEGTDYEFDRKMGRVRFFPGALAPGDDFTCHWAAPSVDKAPNFVLTDGVDESLFFVRPLVTSGITVGLKFIMENANDGDIPLEFEFWQVKLKPDGELAGIGDDWAQLGFTGVVESVSTIPSPVGTASNYGRILGRKSFST